MRESPYLLFYLKHPSNAGIFYVHEDLMNINELLAQPRATAKSRRPDFILKAMNKTTDQRTGKIGAAWINQDGSIALVLDPAVQIHSDPELVIMLFPNDRDELENPPSKRPTKRGRVYVDGKPK
jgi:hypothetical protein